MPDYFLLDIGPLDKIGTFSSSVFAGRRGARQAALSVFTVDTTGRIANNRQGSVTFFVGSMVIFWPKTCKI